MEGEDLSKHEIKEMKRTEREESRVSASENAGRKKIIKSSVKWGILILVLAGIVLLFYRAAKISSDFEPYTEGSVHWHADFDVFLCGERLDFSSLGGANTHVGSPLLHTHGDHKVHIEGAVSRAEDISIGNFFTAIGHKLSSNSFDDYTNENDRCGGDNSVVLLVNGEENPEFENYILKDGDVIEVRYE